MKRILSLFLGMALATASIHAQSISLLNSDPDVVYLDDHLSNEVRLTVIIDSKVFSDKNGTHRLGTLLKNQSVKLEAMTERAYRVRGKGLAGGISGWVSPKAFESASDPEFVSNLEKLYERQLVIQELIRNREVAIGMTMLEVSRSLGEPQKRTVRRTAKGENGTWDYIEYEEEKIYNTFRDSFTGQPFRRYSHTEIKELSRTTLEFTDGLVAAISESEDTSGRNLRIVVPPITYHW